MMKRTFYVLILTLALVVFSPVGIGLADVACPTDTPVPPVDTPMSPTETRVPNTQVPVPTSTRPLPTYPPTPTEEGRVTPISDPTPTEEVFVTPTRILTAPPQPSPYPIITETSPYPAPDKQRNKTKPTQEVLPKTGFFDENPFAPLIVLAVVCVSAFGFSRFVRKHGNS